MQLLTRRENSSFYESFSDLIFCTLVLFIIIVMILALSVNEQVETYAKEQEEINQKLEEQKNELKEKREELSSLKEEALKEQEELIKQEKQLEKIKENASKERQKLRDIIGETRFTSHFGSTKFHFVCDSMSSPPRFWPIPSEIFSEFNSNVFGETLEDKETRNRNLRKSVSEIIENTRSYSAKEIALIVRSFSYYKKLTDDNDKKTVGITMNQEKDGIRVLGIVEDSPAKKAGIKKGDLITHVEGIPLTVNGTSTFISEVQKVNSGETLKLTVVSSNQIPKEISCTTTTGFQYSRVIVATHNSFNLLASGIFDINGKTRDSTEIKNELEKRLPGFKSKSFSEFEKKGLEVIANVGNTLKFYNDLTVDVDGSMYRPSDVGSLPEIKIHVNEEDETGTIADIRLTANEILQIIHAIGGRGAVVSWEVPGDSPIPRWVIEKVLKPAGYTEKVPRL